MPQQIFATILANDPLIAGHKVVVCDAPARFVYIRGRKNSLL